MYQFNYQHLHQSGSALESKYKDITVLKAIFLFGDEITPSERGVLRERYKTTTRMIKDKFGVSCQDLGPLNKYLMENEGAHFSGGDVLFGRGYFRHRSVFTITPLLFRLGFKLREEALGCLPLEQMINLNELNHFVLTGNMSFPPRPEKLEEAPETIVPTF
jgi:hypothetical protein